MVTYKDLPHELFVFCSNPSAIRYLMVFSLYIHRVRDEWDRDGPRHICYTFVVFSPFALQKCIDEFSCSVNEHLDHMGTFNLKNRGIHSLPKHARMPRFSERVLMSPFTGGMGVSF